jgi:hypothetical protein
MVLLSSYYDTLISNKVLMSALTFNAEKSLLESSTCLLSCKYLDEYYFDTLLYMYIYGGIYDAFEKYIIDNKSTTLTINEFVKRLGNLKIVFDKSTSITGSSPTNKIVKLESLGGASDLNASFKVTFYFQAFKEKWQTRGSDDSDSFFNKLGNRVEVTELAKFDSNPAVATTHFNSAGYTKYTDDPGAEGTPNFNNPINLNKGDGFTKTYCDGTANFTSKRDETGITDYTDNARKQKLYQIIYHILSLKDYNLLGELKTNYYTYALYAYNLTIQITLRRNYLQREQIYQPTGGIWNANENTLWTKTTETYIVPASGTATAYKHRPDIKRIYDKIEGLNTYLTNIYNKLKNDADSNLYINFKQKYKTDINDIQKIDAEYATIQDKLNRVIKIYNDYINTYKNLKFYAKIVIITLIIIIVGIIILSILPSISADTKNVSYIIGLIITAVIIYIYYDKFKYVNYEERFGNNVITYDQRSGTSGTTPPCTSGTCASDEGHRFDYTAVDGSSDCTVFASYDKSTFGQYHIAMYNSLKDSINKFIAESNKITSILNNLYLTTSDELFRVDADRYMKKVVKHKIETIKVNKMKYTTLLELIQVMKGEINFLFNLILLILFFVFVLLLGLFIYSTIPQLFILNIIICSIVIISSCTYFIIAIVQPTRKDAVKNYLANYKPSQETIGRL